MYVIIIGCGSSGSHLANILSDQGEDVVIVDTNEHSFNNLTPEFTGFTINGDGTDIDVLKQAKMERADLVVATTDYDNVNAMITQIAKKIFSVPKVLVRIINISKMSFYDDLDVEVFSPINLLVEKFKMTIYGD